MNTFEKFRHVNEYGEDFWYARALQKILNYEQWPNFLKVIYKGKEACKNSGQIVEDHFAEVSKMVEIRSGAKRKIDDYKFSRYACYLIFKMLII